MGKISVVVLVIVILGIIFAISKKEERLNVKALTYSSIAVALAFVLNQVILWKMPQGGSLTAFSMVFIVLVGYLFGVRQGILAGIALGTLNLLIDPYVVHPVQLLLDYPLAFGALGIGGIFKGKHLVSAYILGVFGRFVCHVLSGVIFFAEYANGVNVWVYSSVYNGTYLGLEAIITCVILLIPAVNHAFERIRNNLI